MKHFTVFTFTLFLGFLKHVAQKNVTNSCCIAYSLTHRSVILDIIDIMLNQTALSPHGHQ